VSGQRFALFLLGSWGAVLLLVAASLLRRRDTRSIGPVDRIYLAFCERLARSGCPRQPGETPGQYAERLALEFPALAPAVRDITDRYNELAYVGVDPGAAGALRAQFRARVRRFRPSRARRA